MSDFYTNPPKSKTFIPITLLVQRIDLDIVKKIKGELIPPDFCLQERHGKIEYYQLDRVNAFLLQEKQFAISFPDEVFCKMSRDFMVRGKYVLDNHEIKLDEPRNEMKRDILSVVAYYSVCTRTEILWALRFLEFRRQKDGIKTRYAKNAIMGRIYHDSVLKTITWCVKKGYLKKEKYKYGNPVTYRIGQRIRIMADVKYFKPIDYPFEQKGEIISCLLDLKLIREDYRKIATELSPERKKQLYGFTSESSKYIRGK